MKRKLLLAFAAFLVLIGIGAAIFGHAFYQADGHLGQRTYLSGLIAVLCIVVALWIAKRETHEKPIDLTEVDKVSFARVKLGVALIGPGLICLIFVAPMIYSILKSEGAEPGTSRIISDFPGNALHPALHWLHINIGDWGPALPFVVLGLALILWGWKVLSAPRRA